MKMYTKSTFLYFIYNICKHKSEQVSVQKLRLISQKMSF